MNATVKIQQRGTITLPKKIRESFGLEEGSLLRLKKQGSGVLIEPIQEHNPELHKEIMDAYERGKKDVENGRGVTFSTIEELHHKMGIKD